MLADFDWAKPTVGGSSGTWGTELNTILDVIQAHPGIKVVADATAKAAYVPLLGQVIMQADTGKLYKCTNATGPVWAEVSPAATADGTLTTKGDLLVYGSALSRLGVGTNGQVLTADSAQALGVKWATPTGGSGTPAGDGTEDTHSTSLKESNGTFTTWVSFIEVLSSFWLASIKYYIGSTAGSVTVNLRTAGGTLLASKNIASTSGTAWNTFTLANPVYLEANSFYAVEVLFGSSQKLWYRSDYQYSGTLWKLRQSRTDDWFSGTNYPSITPGLGLVEYDDTP